MSTLWLIVPAAGQGKRMGADKPKQYLSIAEQPILAHTLHRLYEAFPDAQLVLCLNRDDDWFNPSWVPFTHWQRVEGGAERMDSVLNALQVIAAKNSDLVMVHDVARPCITTIDLHKLYHAAQQYPDGALLAMPVADTMKRANSELRSTATEPRDGLWHALTPQSFRYELLLNALKHAVHTRCVVTDEASAVEALGKAPLLVSGRRDNIKVTHPDDLALATAIMALQASCMTERSS